MADTAYTYSISGMFPNQRVDAGCLGKEITDSAISSASFLYVITNGDVCDIWFDNPLTPGDQALLNGIVAVHQGNPLYIGLAFDPMSTDPQMSVTGEGCFWYNSTSKNIKLCTGAAIESLCTDADIYWSRDGSGFVYLKTPTDDLYIGGSSPSGVLFGSGSLVLGAASLTASERLKVAGLCLIDQDTNAIALDIDSEATGNPLINLQPINANTRGDIAFGTARTADPVSPAVGDLWYESTSGEIKFRRVASTVEVRNAIKLQGYNIATTAPTNQFVLSWDGPGTRWQPVSMASLPGPYSSIVTSTVLTTTTSIVDVLLPGMTVTPPAGTYSVLFFTSVQHGSNNRIVYFSIYAAGVLQAYSESMVQMSSWNNVTLRGSTQARVTVNGSQSIEIRWRTDAGTATALNRSMMLIRVS